MTTTTTQPRRETLQQRIARAGQMFDRNRSTKAYVLLEPSGRAQFVAAGKLHFLLREVAEDPRHQILEIANPTSRAQFIAWAVTPRGKAN